MAVHLSEAIQAIRRAGAHNARVVPMAGQSHTGRQQIEILESGAWNAIATDLSLKMAHDIISEATNRVILG